ncbi:hypothetical protein BC831DRAFT_473888 [Entophlyctis helioformis]|nr:hypothetical protein BC831DRAFT_473888 [Entophlyctis helioformis]
MHTAQLHALQNSTCNKLCTSTIPAADTHFLRVSIEEEYAINWVVDGLPVAQLYQDRATGEVFYNGGFELGTVLENDQTVLNNHYDIIIHYHSKEDKMRVVGALVNPGSLTKEAQDAGCEAGKAAPFVVKSDADNTVQYTYSVYWVPDPIPWGTRWDHYLHVYDPQIHWFSIINSIVIVLILSSMVTMILLRALHRDISRYNAAGEEDGAQDDFGWKMVHADVFRPPAFRMLLSVLVGNGAQLLYMSSVTILFAVLGFLSPSSRGALGTMGLIFYILFSAVAGYVSAVLYKTLQGEHWRQNVVLTTLLVPGTIFGVLLFLNFFLIARQSSAAVPFGTLLTLMAMWFLVSIPLSIAGAFFGFRHPGYENPCRTNQIPRQIPPQPAYLNKYYSALIGGILPFGAIFIELYFLMSSIWSHQIYYMFGFLFFVFIILVVTCSLVSVLICYFQLCAEDYMWSWRAFMTSGASGFYVFLYSVVYYLRKLHLVDGTSSLLYFGWSIVMSLLFTIFTGTIGYAAAFVFVRVIYRSIKID